MTEPSQYFKGRTVQEQMNEVIGYVDVRSAEVATNAIAADVAQVHQDMLDADADASAAAASAAAAAGTLANAVKKTGESSQTVEGDITMSTGDLGVAGDVGVQGQLSVLGGCDLRAPVTVPTPSNNTDAATKKYVDDQDALAVPIAGVNAHAVGLTGNQPNVTGIKSFVTGIIAYPQGWVNSMRNVTASAGDYVKTASFESSSTAYTFILEMLNNGNTGCEYGKLMLGGSTSNNPGAAVDAWIEKGVGSTGNKYLYYSDVVTIAKKTGENKHDILIKKNDVYGNIMFRVYVEQDWGNPIALTSSKITIPDNAEVVNISDYDNVYVPVMMVKQ